MMRKGCDSERGWATTPVVDDRALRPRSGSSAKALLLTVLGELVLPHGGSVWTSTVVRTMALLGVEERNARQALARLADDGTLRSERHGRRARWHLTAAGDRLLTVGTRRIYELGAGEDRWDGRWLVVLCSVPEEQRAKRHQLRTQLAFAGFGFLAPGVAICPHVEREAAANAVLGELELLPGAIVLRAEAGQLVAADDLLARAWDLTELAAAYTGFVAAFEGRAPVSDAERAADLVELVHAWRRFPFLDPGIPNRLLPPHWPGRTAHGVFAERHDAWSPGAVRWYTAAESSG
jgi:phenylacetic acid degradation operon negative regulatory protein